MKTVTNEANNLSKILLLLQNVLLVKLAILSKTISFFLALTMVCTLIINLVNSMLLHSLSRKQYLCTYNICAINQNH